MNKNLNILVLENDITALEEWKNMVQLNLIGGEFVYETNYEKAETLITNTIYDIIIISNYVSEQDYTKLITVIKQKAKATFILFLMHSTSNEITNKVIELGVNSCLQKAHFDNNCLSMILKSIFEIKTLKENIEKLTNKIVATEELIFLSEISHRIRTPLNSIMGFSSILIEAEKNTENLDYLKAIKTSGEKIAKLMDESLGKMDKLKNDKIFEQTNQNPKVNFNKIKQLSILLVEDDLLNVKFVQHILAEYGIKTDVAANGKIAIHKVKENKYDLVLMDLEMPEMNGFEATEYIRVSLKNTVPIIALTAHTMAGEKEKCLKIGMNDYIAKPIEVNLLFGVIYNTIALTVLDEIKMLKPVTNLLYLKETLKGKKDAIKEMLDFIVQQLPVYVLELNSAIEKIDYDAIAKISHKLKSATAILGTKEIEPLLRKLETQGKTGSGIVEIKQWNEELNILCNKAVEEVKHERVKFN
jgi:CheY-like chemotaxis protein